MGSAWVDQEYNGCFTTLEGRVYPEFESALVEETPSAGPKAWHVGGIDFGWRNPFAAVWGFVEAGVLWITGEHSLSRGTLAEHAEVLPKKVEWFADPAAPGDIGQLRRWGFAVRSGKNEIRGGIARVTARLRTGRLKIANRCEHLRNEARLYRYPSERERRIAGENPVDADNHSLAALRYLVSRLEEPL